MTDEIHYYKFNESAGAISYDEKANFNLTGLSGSFTTGKLNNGFAVSGDSVNMGFKPSSLSNDKVSVTFWLKRTGAWAVDGNTFIRTGSTGNDWYIAQKTTHKMWVGMGTDAAPGTMVLSLNTWYHIVVIWDKTAGNVKMYINGDTDTPDINKSGTITYTDENIYFNSMSDGTYKGTNYVIDDLRFYGVALRSEEIKALYNAGTGTEDSLKPKEYTRGQAGLRRDYPVEEGLTARTQKQEGRTQNLVYEEGTTVLLRDKALL